MFCLWSHSVAEKILEMSVECNKKLKPFGFFLSMVSTVLDWFCRFFPIDFHWRCIHTPICMYMCVCIKHHERKAKVLTLLLYTVIIFAKHGGTRWDDENCVWVRGKMNGTNYMAQERKEMLAWTSGTTYAVQFCAYSFGQHRNKLQKSNKNLIFGC